MKYSMFVHKNMLKDVIRITNEVLGPVVQSTVSLMNSLSSLLVKYFTTL